MMYIEREVTQFIAKHRLLSPQGRYLVALSGGADSVALFRILLRLGLQIEAVHCNFKLRGEESFRDEFFCANLCKEHGVAFHTVHFDTAEYAAFHKLSIEMAARDITILKNFGTTLIWMASVWVTIKTTMWKQCSLIFLGAQD